MSGSSFFRVTVPLNLFTNNQGIPMRTILPLFLVIILLGSHQFVTLTSAQERGIGIGSSPPIRYHALVIGNNAYQLLPKLQTAENDAREVDKIFKEIYGFRTKLLLNATRQQIVSALAAYRRDLTTDDNLIVYYAGHGINDAEAGRAYWLPVDATRDDYSNWISADDITAGTKTIPARHVLVISDSCYSGTLTRGLGNMLPRPTEREQFLRKMQAGKSRTLMASGGNEPVADGGGGGHSVFAAALLRGLRTMDKDQFTAAELFRGYVEESVSGRANQTPEYNPLRNSGHESGDFIFTRIKPGKQKVEAAVNAPMSPAAAFNPAAIELSFWESVKNSLDPEDFKEYLGKYPSGQFAGLARRRIASLESAAKASANLSQEPANPTTNFPTNGRHKILPSPSTRYRQINSQLFRLSVPDNWRDYAGQNSVTLAPEGAVDQNGVTHGVTLGIGQSQSRNLRQATDQYVNDVLQGNPHLRQTGNYTRTTVSARAGLATTLSGRAPVTGQTEVVTVVTTLLRDGSIFYMNYVTPQSDQRNYQNAFNQILRSVQLNDSDNPQEPEHRRP